MKPTNFKDLVETYLNNPAVTSLAPASIKRYTALSNSLLNLLNPELSYTSDPAKASEVGSTWFTKLQEEGSSNARVNDHKSHIKRLYIWATKNFGVAYDSNPSLYMKDLKHEKKETSPFTAEDIKTIVDLPVNSKYNKYSPNELLTVNSIVFLYETGMRPQEFRNLRVSDIVMDDNGRDKLLAIRGAKGREEGKVSRYLFVTPKIQECIDVALAHRSSVTTKTDKLFISIKGGEVYAENFRVSFDSTLSKANLPKKEIRDLRRGCATNIIHNPRYGAVVAQKQLGHKHLSTTMIYEDLDKKAAARLFRGFN